MKTNKTSKIHNESGDAVSILGAYAAVTSAVRDIELTGEDFAQIAEEAAAGTPERITYGGIVLDRIPARRIEKAAAMQDMTPDEYVRGVCRQAGVTGCDANPCDETHTDDRGITCSDAPNCVTVTIRGKAYDNLRELASAWDSAWPVKTPASIPSTSPASLLEMKYYCGDPLLLLNQKRPEFNAPTLAGILCRAYDSRRRKNLSRAFESAGFSTAF